MAPKTDTAPAAEAPAPKLCKCGCGETVTRNFAQGHDQRLVSKLAEDIVNGKPPTGMGALSQAKAKRPVAERIELLAAMLTERISEGISAKFEKAALRKVGQNERKANKPAPKTTAHATKAAGRKSRAKAAGDGSPTTADLAQTETPSEDNTVAKRTIGAGEVHTARLGLGASIQIKVRGRVINATVAAMNQAGKVTAATYKGAKDVERRVLHPTVVDPAPAAE